MVELIEVKKYAARPGESIQDVSEEMLSLSDKFKCNIELTFNGKKLTCRHNLTHPTDIEEDYFNLCNKGEPK